jgi:hypothetical protein
MKLLTLLAALVAALALAGTAAAGDDSAQVAEDFVAALRAGNLGDACNMVSNRAYQLTTPELVAQPAGSAPPLTDTREEGIRYQVSYRGGFQAPWIKTWVLVTEDGEIGGFGNDA